MTPERRVQIPVQNLVTQGGRLRRTFRLPDMSGMRTNPPLGSLLLCL